ncbi:N-acetylmuramoyl-L-alanine amidase [Allocoleopsis franciscana]|uniref:N-acetylmuramoyl-L-alanine amidase n=1 Tax=Allocoleopsis franciscana PCC 7113 TaxID=1173027 RepID=K9WE42_9CYAN|nr:N-acetylmuramoyl-L-alanine amidase [Allocoleopsis franciscana]AFZ17802.1 N-acetylmuramoyl-L-alanine amidase [Allocoleopsis franciscana PCC 7113]
MKYGIDIGHNCNPDIGARGIRQEDHLTMEVGTRVISKLKSLGHQVINCKPSRASSVGNSLQQRCNIANFNRVDVFVSIHFNSFNRQANGTEIFTGSDTGRRIAQPVLDNIVKLGFFNRGVKSGLHLYVVKNTNMPAILVECCFCDAQQDMNRYNPDSLSDAIVRGLTGQTAPNPDEAEKKTILELQKALNRLKIRDDNSKPLVEDGIIGNATRSATRNFQRLVGITENGMAGPTTWQAIEQILAKPVLRANHAAGTTVKYLQHQLKVVVDGVYGVVTATAVQVFQRQEGLTADGIVGPKTWDKLFS